MTFGRKSKQSSLNIMALVMGLVVLLGFGYLVSLMIPELRRYMKMRQM